jgi:hypothetical protein
MHAVRHFQFTLDLGKNLNHSWTKKIMSEIGQRKKEDFKGFQQESFGIEPGGKNVLPIICSITYSCLFVVDVGLFDLRTNLLQEGGSDDDMTKDQKKTF